MDPNRRQILMTTAGAAALMASPAAASKASLQTAWRSSQSFDLGWRFYRGTGEGFEAKAFNDSGWRALDLPHDWSIENLPHDPTRPAGEIIGPFDKKSIGGTATGFAVGGEGWYRKHFKLTPPAHGRVEIFFEGVYMNSDVWLNGQHLGVHPYGYTPFAYDLTPFLAADGNNVVAVRVRNLGQNSRWYSGSGIYRHVWLDVLPEKARIARWGVGVVTKQVTDRGADIEIATQLEDISAGLTLFSRINDSAGQKVWEGSAPADANMKQAMTIVSPRLWSPDAPNLYMLETELRRGPLVIDRRATPFGVRIVTFDATNGMTVNGKPAKLRGGCIHHDNGLLGAVSFEAAEDRKVRLLKARGYNALRPSHNPYSEAFLDACDRHGVMVMAETFDCWREGKLPQDYSLYFDNQWRSDLTTIVKSARNHPSIIMWSIGNEIPDRNSPAGVEIQWQLGNLVHEIDPTRPVTAAINDFVGRPVIPSQNAARPGRAGIADQMSAVFLDVAGYNYKLLQYEPDHRDYPQRIMFGSESFPKDIFAIWDLTDKSPWLMGDFVWTAMDYLGEAGIGGTAYAAPGTPALAAMMSAWPNVVSNCGDIDLIGNQKGASFARDVVWGISALEIAVQKPPPGGKVELARPWGWSDERQSWTWPGMEGKTIAVRVYTSGDKAELHLNGKLVDSKNVTAADLKHMEFETTYAPGTLEVIAFKGGVEIARRHLTTAGAPAGIRLVSEKAAGGAKRNDVSYVAVEIVDAKGQWVPNVVKDLQIFISGPADLIGFGSADPNASNGFQSTTTQSWDGRALAILRGKGKTGSVKITVHGDGLQGGAAVLHLI